MLCFTLLNKKPASTVDTYALFFSDTFEKVCTYLSLSERRNIENEAEQL